jgi:DNA-binding SARP family transcriptional activator
MERDRLQDHFLHALEAHAARLAARGDYVSALLVIHDALSADPFRDSAVLVQLAIHIAEGNSALAARIFVDFRRRLDAEVGTKPSDEMREMIAALITRSG